MSIAKITFSALALAAAVLSPLQATAQDACYAPKDADGTFANKKLLSVALAGVEVAPGQPQLSNAQFNGVKRCLSKAAQRGSGFRGSFELGLRTDAEGKVKRVSVLEEEFENPVFSACVAQLACEWQIAGAPAGAPALLSFSLGKEEKQERPDFLDGRKVKDSQAYK